MKFQLWVAFASVLFAGALSASFAGDAPSADADLAEYHTVANAITTNIADPKDAASPRTGYLGVRVSPADGKLKVDDVEDASPAQRAGVKRGDAIVDIDAQPIATLEALRDSLQSHSPGDEVKLGVRRENQSVTLDVILAATSRPMRLGGRRALMGVSIGEETEAGALVSSVTAGLPAETAGIKPGDWLMRIDGVPLNSAARMSDNLAQKQPGETITVDLRRDDEDLQLKLQLAADKQPDARVPQPAPMTYWRKDNYRLAVICVEFPDMKHNIDIQLDNWQEAFFSEGTYKDKSITGEPAYGSLRDFYLEQSYGHLHVRGEMFDWVQVGKERGEYAKGTGVSSFNPFLTEVCDLVLARQGNDALDGFDGVMILYAGSRYPGTSRGGLYWPHRSTFPYKGKKVSYFIVPEGGNRMDSVSTPCHEFGHMLGLPDLYSRPENPGSVGLGPWCTMSIQAPGGRPQQFSAWCKEQLGWIKPTVIDPTVKQKLILSPIENSPNECFKIIIRADGSEYLLLENRRKIGFDQSIPAEGLLIWRVVNDRPVLEASHGVDGPSGPVIYLSSVPYPSIANNAFTPFTTPSSRSMLGGGLPVYLTNIRKLPDGRITFYVGYEYE